MTTFADIQRATIAARDRTGGRLIGTEVKAGRIRVVSVQYPSGKRGLAVVTPLSEFLAAAEVVHAIDRI